MEWLQIVVLALVQGLTEFLPISSSAHLILVPIFTDWEDQGLAFDLALHVGSLIAVIFYFRQDLLNMLHSWVNSLYTRRINEEAKLAWAVILGTLPVGIFGLLMKNWIETDLRGPYVMAGTLIGFGLLLGIADWFNKGQRSTAQMNWKDVSVVAFAQVLALIPGTSRSGITITAALLMGLSRDAAARFSFLLSIPVITLASLLAMYDLMRIPADVPWLAMFWGALIAGLSAYGCIHYFMALIRRIGMQPFVIYRILLGGLLIWFFW